MAIKADVSGNLLEQPTQRMVTTGRGQIRITEFRMMADYWKSGPNDTLVQDDDKSSPVQVTIWSDHLGDRVMKLIKKGMRVEASGELYLHSFVPSDQDRSSAAASGKELKDFHGMRLSAEKVSLALNRVEAITMQPRRSAAGASAQAEPAESA